MIVLDLVMVSLLLVIIGDLFSGWMVCSFGGVSMVFVLCW